MTAVVRTIAAVIVTYNSADVLRDCLRSLPDGARGSTLDQVIVADNASSDESVRIAKEATGLPIEVVQLGRNAGYAAAVNAGVRAATGADAVLVLNPDCRLRPGALAVLAEALAEPKVGITVPKLVNPDGSLQPSLRRSPSVPRALTEALIGGHRAGRLGTLGELITDEAAHDVRGDAAWATGAAMLLRAELVADLGPWDETFLLYGEETEYALRAWDNGWRLRYDPAAVFEHIGGESDSSPMLHALLTVNRVRLFQRRSNAFSGLAYYLCVLLGEALRALAGRRTAREGVVWLTRPSRRLRVLPGG